MTALILVLVVIVAFIFVKDERSGRKGRTETYGWDRRKTNAVKEQAILDGFMRQGKTFQEAYLATIDEVTRLGYVPCIPLTAYGVGGGGQKYLMLNPKTEETSHTCSWPGHYDSYLVGRRRDHLRELRIPLTDENIYANFPTTNSEYERELYSWYRDGKRTELSNAVPVGEKFIHPKYGIVEVIGHDYSMVKPITRFLTTWGGCYIVEVMETGEIIRDVEIDGEGYQRLP